MTSNLLRRAARQAALHMSRRLLLPVPVILVVDGSIYEDLCSARRLELDRTLASIPVRSITQGLAHLLALRHTLCVHNRWDLAGPGISRFDIGRA